MLGDINAAALQTLFRLILQRPGLSRDHARLGIETNYQRAFGNLDVKAMAASRSLISTITAVLAPMSLTHSSRSSIRKWLWARARRCNSLPGVSLDMLIGSNRGNDTFGLQSDVTGLSTSRLVSLRLPLMQRTRMNCPPFNSPLCGRQCAQRSGKRRSKPRGNNTGEAARSLAL